MKNIIISFVLLSLNAIINSPKTYASQLSNSNSQLLVQIQSKSISTKEIPFKICTGSKTWVRPTKEEQIAELQPSKRYGDVTQGESRKLFENYWRHKIFSFTSFGNSAFQDYRRLAGLWNLRNTKDVLTWQCGGQANANAINAKEIAEVWIMYHQIISIKWADNHYIMIVSPTQRGVQFIQFSRREHRDSLPLIVRTESGNKVPVMAQ
ncbi:MAG: hypothetical protein V7L23_23420 [Nostoc sp.]|uniref:hypothetical protein n=1 Tax=Nostoc sp. TaxID=1180 RepID=UPI002FF1422C